VLPQQAPLWDTFDDAVRDWLHGYGYRQLRLPVLERTELFTRTLGEATDIVEKEMYTFVDMLNGESLTLRPEGTASCVRAVLQHNMLYTGAQRLYYRGPMFRHERPQKGRFRQFHQVGVEAFGFAGPDIDAEHLVMTNRLWRSLGIDNLRLQINTLGSPEERARYRVRLIKYLDRHSEALDGDARRRLYHNPLRVLDSKNPAMHSVIDQAPKLLDDLDETSLQQFDELQVLLRQAGVAFTINPGLVRGLDYYNLTVYEWVSADLGAQGTVCAGGRYDGLVEQLGGKPTPACGFALGVERLLALLEQAGRVIAQPAADAYVVHQGPAADALAWRVSEMLRDSGFHVIRHSGGGSFKAQMKKADASAARHAVIIGEDEAAVGEVSVKPLRGLGEQQRVAIDDVAELLRGAR
ncbi:MAG: histidine--tRNA ligase, partial [Burkholderiales bacterium]